MNEMILALFWMTYYAIHSAMASDRIKTFLSITIPAFYPYYRLVYSVFALLNLLLLLQLHVIVPSESIFESRIAPWIGFTLCLAAAVVLLVSIRSYGIGFLIRESREDELVTTGLNSIVRHPLYFGTLLLLIGVFLILPKWKNLVVLVISSLYLVIGSLLEERKLIARFGEDYISYRERVNMLIPGLF
jgi:protein-S-isoprenylcysteine O-methyltransferase Ste14